MKNLLFPVFGGLATGVTAYRLIGVDRVHDDDKMAAWAITLGSAAGGAIGGLIVSGQLSLFPFGVASDLPPGIEGLGMKMHPLHPSHPYNNGHKVFMHGMGEQEEAPGFLAILGAAGVLALLLLPKG
jgi:hypothetical protein